MKNKVNKINELVNNSLYVDFNESENVKIDLIILDTPSVKNKLTLSERSMSLVPQSVKNDILKLENLKIMANEEKIHPSASISYGRKKEIDNVKLNVSEFYNNIKNIEIGLRDILNTKFLNDEEKESTVTSVLESLERGFNGKELKLKSVYNASNDVNYRMSQVKFKIELYSNSSVEKNVDSSDYKSNKRMKP